MSRSRSHQTQVDHVVDVPQGQRFRLFAVEPHGWSTFFVEDHDGSYYLGSVATGTLVKTASDVVEQLLTMRVYRRWNGEREWAALAELPLVASTFARQVMPVEHGEGQQAAY